MKQKESIFEQEIIEKKKQVTILESQIFDSLKIQRSASIDDPSLKLKQHEFRIKELKKEKLYLKDKIGSAESSVVSFIGEMNEVLDNHEITAMFIDQNREQGSQKKKELKPTEIETTVNLKQKRNSCTIKKSTKFASRKSIKSNFLTLKMNMPKKGQGKQK